MKTQIEQVRLFMQAAEQFCPEKPTIPTLNVQMLRLGLHKEEAFIELSNAFLEDDLTKVLDSICDSLVVVFGTALACGFSPAQVEAGFAEVMRSNMTKFLDGYKRPDGKWEKGVSYSKANLEPIVNQ
jgi:predicted HAD superfamily Cof-like phosphohydrolase